MTINKLYKTTTIILFACGFLILLYTIIRASVLSITYDESYTYLEFVMKGIFTLDSYGRMSANNHFLNTWMMDITTFLFGNSELSLRLPNLLAHLLFISYSARLLSKLSSKTLVISSFLILNLNPFLLDFFIVARGYGIAIGFMMMSLYYSYLFIAEKASYKKAMTASILSSVAVLANFTLIGYMMASICLLAFINFYRKIKVDKTKSFLMIIKETFLIISPLSILFIIIPITMKMQEAGSLFYGGDSGFWKDTVISLIMETLYGNLLMDHLQKLFQAGIVITFISSFIIILMNFSKTKSFHKNAFLLFLFLILFSCFLMNYSEHQLMGILFLQERTALFYFPLFILLVAFLFDDLIHINKSVFQGIYIAVAFVFIFNFFISINFHYVKSWKRGADTKDLVNYIIQNKTTTIHGEKPIILGIYKWDDFFQNSIRYYKVRGDINWLVREDYSEENKDDADYVFADKSDIDSLNNPSLKMVKEFPCSNMVLFTNTSK